MLINLDRYKISLLYFLSTFVFMLQKAEIILRDSAVDEEDNVQQTTYDRPIILRDSAVNEEDNAQQTTYDRPAKTNSAGNNENVSYK